VVLQKYKIIEHTADLGAYIYGKDMEELFINSVLTLMELLVCFESNNLSHDLPISISAEDPSDLIVRWLGEILYLFNGDSLVVTGVKILALTPQTLEATLQTCPLEGLRYEIVHEIKAVTYHQVEVLNKGNHWQARVFFDL
jgi:SHS2 domain-containing protein